MQAYTIYIKKEKDSIVGIEYVPEGFTWLGFILNGFWLIYNRLWRPFAFFVLTIIMLNQMEYADVITPTISMVVLLGLSLYIGLSGYDMIRKRLERMGYELHDVVFANSDAEAGLKYLKYNFIIDDNAEESNSTNIG
jgi:hypothetical protein